jgi:hypothetical protein
VIHFGPSIVDPQGGKRAIIATSRGERTMQRNSFAARAQFAPNSRALRELREAGCGELSKHLRANENLCYEWRVVHKEQGFM